VEPVEITTDRNFGKAQVKRFCIQKDCRSRVKRKHRPDNSELSIGDLQLVAPATPASVERQPRAARSCPAVFFAAANAFHCRFSADRLRHSSVTKLRHRSRALRSLPKVHECSLCRCAKRWSQESTFFQCFEIMQYTTVQHQQFSGRHVDLAIRETDAHLSEQVMNGDPAFGPVLFHLRVRLH
jgi:hypothetical protein